jgi:organic hydroperoxide reductase OsmC/OhrA
MRLSVPEEITHRITLKLDKGYEFLATFESWPDLPPIRCDEAPPVGEARGPTATGVLATAIGNCLAASLLFCLRRSHADVRDLTARVTARVVRNEQGRLRVGGLDVELVPVLSAESAPSLERCAEIFQDFCVVTQSVRQGIPVAVTLTTPETA